MRVSVRDYTYSKRLRTYLRHARNGVGVIVIHGWSRTAHVWSEYQRGFLVSLFPSPPEPGCR
jgi:hypothetical protein